MDFDASKCDDVKIIPRTPEAQNTSRTVEVVIDDRRVYRYRTVSEPMARIL